MLRSLYIYQRARHKAGISLHKDADWLSWSFLHTKQKVLHFYYIGKLFDVETEVYTLKYLDLSQTLLMYILRLSSSSFWKSLKSRWDLFTLRNGNLILRVIIHRLFDWYIERSKWSLNDLTSFSRSCCWMLLFSQSN